MESENVLNVAPEAIAKVGAGAATLATMNVSKKPRKKLQRVYRGSEWLVDSFLEYAKIPSDALETYNKNVSAMLVAGISQEWIDENLKSPIQVTQLNRLAGGLRSAMKRKEVTDNLHVLRAIVEIVAKVVPAKDLVTTVTESQIASETALENL